MEEGNNFHIVEWSIENFSCWNCEIHGPSISSPNTWVSPCEDPYLSIVLFKRGLKDNEEHMFVRICPSQYRSLLGDVSFIGSDGSLLCTQQLDSKMVLLFLDLPGGPKFEEVVARIREKEGLCKDSLTLRLRYKDIDSSVEYMRTKIGASHTSLKISSYIFNRLKKCSDISICIDYEENRDIFLVFSKVCSKIELVLEPGFSFEKKISVLTRMTVLNSEDVVRTEENGHLFRDDSKWIFSSSLTLEEVAKKESSLVLYIKIISKNKLEHVGGFSFLNDNSFHNHLAVPLMPSNRYRPPGTSVTKECHSKILTEVPLDCNLLPSNQPENALRDLSKELMCLYQDQDFSDFQLKCGDVSIPVHRNILSARSPVFKTMLSTDMKETVTGCMDIEDLEPSTLGLFLAYLYTGTVDDLKGESALKLYYAADKYQVPSLKMECADFLSDNVSISNVCDVLSLADKHQDEQLTSAAHDFILKNFNEVLRSPEWKSFMRSEPLLAVETVTHFAQQNRVGEISSA